MYILPLSYGVLRYIPSSRARMTVHASFVLLECKRSTILPAFPPCQTYVGQTLAPLTIMLASYYIFWYLPVILIRDVPPIPAKSADQAPVSQDPAIYRMSSLSNYRRPRRDLPKRREHSKEKKPLAPLILVASRLKGTSNHARSSARKES